MASVLPQSQTDSQIIVGVDIHKDFHVAVVITVMGVVVGSRAFPATAAGYQELIGWAGSYGVVSRAGVEGTGSYGAGLARLLREAGVDVVEVNRPNRAMCRRRGKNDTVDAEAAARAVLSGEAAVTPKSGDGPVEAIRVLKLAKDSAVKARGQAINQLKAVLVNAEPQLREELASPQSQPARCPFCEPGFRGISRCHRRCRTRAQSAGSSYPVPR
ncbi:transposase [Saccharopolyspora shandongensis]|uniref:IS110 family transposase n=1 Tax=Saccharopolyspora shandongensis TaxID=418495 RepID=UPI0034275A06